MTVGLALIVKDEEQRLPVLLASIVGAFDDIVLVDTGSTDATVQVFKDWAAEHGQPVQVHDFAWVKDFSAARAFADSKLMTTWLAWADADDFLEGADKLRTICAQAPDHVAGFIAGYDYAQDHEGRCLCYLRRERLVRKGAGRWVGRVHEAQLIAGPTMQLRADDVEWRHRKPWDDDTTRSSNERNLEILHEWNAAEPDTPRIVGYLGTELANSGRFEEALPWFEQYLALRPDWEEERAQVHRKHAVTLIALNRLDDARRTATDALHVVPSWPDSYLTLAQVALLAGEPGKAIQWAERVLQLGVPDTMLIINPTDYTAAPHAIIAGAYGVLGRPQEALAAAEKAADAGGLTADMLTAARGWRTDVKREVTARNFVGQAQLLVQHDEQLKALDLLERCVPHYAHEHPLVVGARSELRERLNWVGDPEAFAVHYESGGSKPEDFHSDERAAEIAARLPRVRFLLAGLEEQIAA